MKPSAKHARPSAGTNPAGWLLVVLILILIVIGFAAWHAFAPKPGAPVARHLTVYYAKTDGHSMGTWDVSTRSPQTGSSGIERLHDEVLYAAVQAVAGPPSDVSAIRFPTGTHVLGVSIDGAIATVDLSPQVDSQAGGELGENGEFKELVYTVTGVPGIDAVKVTVAGRALATLPGGQFELDTPLRRSDW